MQRFTLGDVPQVRNEFRSRPDRWAGMSHEDGIAAQLRREYQAGNWKQQADIQEFLDKEFCQ